MKRTFISHFNIVLTLLICTIFCAILSSCFDEDLNQSNTSSVSLSEGDTSTESNNFSCNSSEKQADSTNDSKIDSESEQFSESISEAHEHCFIEKVTEIALKSPATCIKKAEYYLSCSCGKLSSDLFEYGDYAPHNTIIDHSINATCTTVGLTEGSHCSVCNYIIQNQIETPPLGHNYIFHTGEKETCTTCGWSDYNTCSRCDFSSFCGIPATGHSIVVNAEIQASCTESGYTQWSYCSKCGEIIVNREIISALGHNLSFHPAQPETCTNDGWNEYESCDRCSYSTFEKIPAHHKYNSGICSVCGNIEKTDIRYFACTPMGNGYSIGLEEKYRDTLPKGVSLPDTYIGKPIIAIATDAFNKCDQLEQIILPESIIFINNRAFQSCTRLANINIPNKTENIGAFSFAECTSLKSITIPDKVITIGSNAFYKCTFSEISIPDSVKTIQEAAFKECNYLKSIRIPFIGMSRNATGYESIFGYIFGYKISNSDVPGATKQYTSDYTQFSDSKTYYYFIPSSLKSVAIGDSIEKIPDYAFRNCKITSITLGNQISSIGNLAFYSCSISSITITKRVSRIGDQAFNYSSLQNAFFENPCGWSASSTKLEKTDLENSTTAAEFLKNKYCGFYSWVRSD